MNGPDWEQCPPDTTCAHCGKDLPEDRLQDGPFFHGYCSEDCFDASDPWILFTKRTNDPKLSWLIAQLERAGIPHKRNGESLHAPILLVRNSYLDRAWAILDPVDDIPDDAGAFWGPYNGWENHP